MSIETAYFLGAGASKALYPTLPVANELTLEYLLNPRGSDKAVERVERYIASESWSREERFIPFEQIYPKFPGKLAPLFPRENLELCLFRKLKFENYYDYMPVFDSWLTGNLDSGYPVLTTNYDTVIESGVQILSVNFNAGELDLVDYGVPDDLCLRLPAAGSCLASGRNRLLLLKLYGSVSWCHCQKCGKYLLDTINDSVAEHAYMGRGTCRGRNCGGTRHNAVFVPLAGKKTSDDLALGAIWDRTEQVLSDSRHIVFAGFSLHPNDVSIGELLKRAYSARRTEKVTVVLRHSDPEILDRYRKVYGARVESYDLGWRKYLEELVKSRRWQRRT